MDIYIEEYMAEDFVISIILQMSFCLLKGDNIDNWWVLVEENLLVESVSTVPCFFFKFISLETMFFLGTWALMGEGMNLMNFSPGVILHFQVATC